MLFTKSLRSGMLILISIFFSVGVAFAQQITIKGQVTAAGDEALPGVTVVVDGTVTGTITDIDGNYTLDVPDQSAVLIFSFVGFKTQKVPVGSQTTLNIRLEADVMGIDEVVVTGYSTQRKRDLTGAVAIVEAEELTAQPTGNVANQLQGRTAGVTVTGSGEPGETSSVRIRGFSSFENNDPLYIVDGVPTQDISSLNPNDVQSMSVLKDAGAASIYGSRASNGVIIVTTKKGSGGVKVSYSMYAGTQLAGKGPVDDLLTTQEYADLQWLVYANDGTSETHPIYGASSNASPTLPDWAANTNWYDELTNNAPIQNHDISLSGGNEKAKFFAGLGYFDQEGIFNHNWAKRYSARFNSEFKVLDGKLTVGENASIAHRSGVGVTNLGEGSPLQMGVYRSQSIIPVIIPEGQTIEGGATAHTFVPGDWGGTGIAPRLGNAGNVYANLYRDKDDVSQNLNFTGSMFANLEIIPGLNLKTTFGGQYYTGYYTNYTFATYENSENTATPAFTEGASFGGNWTWSTQLNYSKTFGDHSLSALVGYERNKLGMGRNVFGTRADYFSDDVDYRTLSNGATIQNAASSANTPVSLASEFAKLDYTFKEKYILSATIRRDGSSVFSEDTRYGVFPAFAGGWQLGDEDFMQDIEFISNLKIRGSWGTMGNQLAVSPMNAFYLYSGTKGYSDYDIGGTMNSAIQGFRLARIGNPDAKWETNVTTDIGFETLLFDGKIGLVFDWYSKQTKDLLFNPELPATSGNASAPYVNIASMSNKGMDIELRYKDNIGDLDFEIAGTVTTVNNEITALAEGVDYFDTDVNNRQSGAFNRNMVGHPMSAFYGYQVIGLFQNAADVSSSPTQDGAEPGFFKFQDTNGDGSITDDDRTWIGNPNPDFTYGLNIALNWKNFDLTAFIYGSYGNDIYNFNRFFLDFWPSFQGQKSKDLLYNSWTESNTGATTPKASNTSNFSTNTQTSSYYVEDGSYARLKNLTLGYTLPESLLSKVGIGSVRAYVQGVNLFTITNYSNLDPEIGVDADYGDSAYGVDTGNYPTVKQIIFGLNVSF
ncbi:TonB-dependent receptor [uncultured Draconibacterium sp.]|uniref:SusC/RagA family TonB-linked outer membrane protein n=1 Tax=uncultured Draconibacterium sp. TaxID=1573823 RepID=UPI003216F42A